MKMRSHSHTFTLVSLLATLFVGCNQEEPASLSDKLEQSTVSSTPTSSVSNQATSPAGTQLGNPASRCNGSNQVWGLTADSKTTWYAIKKQVLPVEGIIGNEGYIETGKDASYDAFNFELLFDVEKLDSQNPLRDTRIRSMFFADYAVSPFTLNSIAIDKEGSDFPLVGNTDKVELNGTIEIAGVLLDVTVPAYITRTLDALRIVNSDEPTKIDVSTDSTLVRGVQSLLEVANLGPDDMEDTVAIKFDYTFKQACPN